MSLTSLAPELLHQIFNSLATISDVLNLSLSCHHLQLLLRASQKLPTLFLAANREFGPVEDIIQLVTYNSSQPAHIKRQPQQNYALLRQMIKVGSVGKKVQELYPSRRWQDNYLERRSLTEDECWRVRRAVYRFWLYCEAFQNRDYTRGRRNLPMVVEERAQLLRTWSTDDLIEVEDLRSILEDLITEELCPTDGAAQQSFNEHCDFSDVRFHRYNQQSRFQYAQQAWNSWPPYSQPSRLPLSSSLFHNIQDEPTVKYRSDVPVAQRRKLEMMGWGDEISQYYVVQSMMKLNPAQIIYLHENATTKSQVELYIAQQSGFEPDDQCRIGDEWFWDNGQTWLDTWSLVLARRGDEPRQVREAVRDGEVGITSRKTMACGNDETCLESSY